MESQWISSRIADGALIVHGHGPFVTLSSALLGGGLQQKRHLVNAQVAHGYRSHDPVADLEAHVARLGLPLGDTVGMMTAANVERVVEGYAYGDQFRLQVYVTAGVGNAARAGTARKTYPGYLPGTINIIAVLDARLTEAAMVNAVLTVTEAKTAALQDLGVPDALHLDKGATGTTTDAVVIAVTQESAYTGVHQYAGVATELGNALATTVHQSLLIALETWREDEEVMLYGL